MANEEQKSEPVSESKEIIVEKITETPEGVIESQNEIVEKQTKELDSIIGDEGNKINIEGSKQDIQEFEGEAKEIKTEADETKEKYYEELRSNIPNLDDRVEFQKKETEKQEISVAKSQEVLMKTDKTSGDIENLAKTIEEPNTKKPINMGKEDEPVEITEENKAVEQDSEKERKDKEEKIESEIREIAEDIKKKIQTVDLSNEEPAQKRNNFIAVDKEYMSKLSKILNKYGESIYKLDYEKYPTAKELAYYFMDVNGRIIEAEDNIKKRTESIKRISEKNPDLTNRIKQLENVIRKRGEKGENTAVFEKKLAEFNKELEEWIDLDQNPTQRKRAIKYIKERDPRLISRIDKLKEFIKEKENEGKNVPKTKEMLKEAEKDLEKEIEEVIAKKKYKKTR